MSFKVANLPSLFGKPVDTLLPANATRLGKPSVSPDVKQGPVTNLGFGLSSFDLDGDGKSDVERRRFNWASADSFVFHDDEGNKAIAISLGAHTNKIQQVITVIGSDITLRRDLDGDGKVDFEKKLTALPE
ncbi:MAG: hypothetical protein JNM69_29920 [Archangium sp.]|nr:hypothetical protein [Archangium sp.]